MSHKIWGSVWYLNFLVVPQVMLIGTNVKNCPSPPLETQGNQNLSLLMTCWGLAGGPGSLTAGHLR